MEPMQNNVLNRIGNMILSVTGEKLILKRVIQNVKIKSTITKNIIEKTRIVEVY